MQNHLIAARERIRALIDLLLFHQGKRVAHFAHRFEDQLHVAYLGGVAFGGGYRYAAIGMLICIFFVWCLEEH